MVIFLITQFEPIHRFPQNINIIVLITSALGYSFLSVCLSVCLSFCLSIPSIYAYCTIFVLQTCKSIVIRFSLSKVGGLNEILANLFFFMFHTDFFSDKFVIFKVFATLEGISIFQNFHHYLQKTITTYCQLLILMNA